MISMRNFTENASFLGCLNRIGNQIWEVPVTSMSRLQTFSPTWRMTQPECRDGPSSGIDMMHGHLVI